MVLSAILGLTLTASAARPVPFKGYADVVLSGPPVAIPGGDHLSATATGQATHLGNYTRTEELDVVGGALTGTVTFVAANGDELYVDVAGAFTSMTTAEGTYTVTGGTGRFSGASGEATFEAVALEGGQFFVTFEGSIEF